MSERFSVDADEVRNGETLYFGGVEYVPKRTCKATPTTVGNIVFTNEPVHEYECSACDACFFMFEDDEPAYCPHCGARVVVKMECENVG